MSRFWLGLGLLLATLALGLWIGSAMTDTHNTVCDTLTQAAEKALSGDIDAGMRLAKQAQQLWQKRWNTTAAVADHSPMEEIDGLFAQLESYARTGHEEEFAALCSQLSKRVRAMGEAHSLTWYNLLCAFGKV